MYKGGNRCYMLLYIQRCKTHVRTPYSSLYVEAKYLPSMHYMYLHVASHTQYTHVLYTLTS
jgi:hypothetical protein